LQREDMDWRAAQASNTVESLQHFVQGHPHSRHVPDASGSISALKDRAEIVKLLQAYQDSYNRRDLKQFLQLWPSSPANVQSLFKQKQSGTLSLSAKETPVVMGDIASLKVVIIRQTETGESTLIVPFQFKKQNDHWIIERGSL
jgi:hypothetical protein